MQQQAVHLRHAGITDIDAINRVIALAIAQWSLPERVKRLTLPSYLYTELDLDHLEIIAAEISGSKTIVGLATLEPASSNLLPEHETGLLLHGLYVEPAYQHQQIGRKLIDRCLQTVANRRLGGLLVKAQPEAAAFFHKLGMRLLQATDPERDYPHRFWLPVDGDQT